MLFAYYHANYFLLYSRRNNIGAPKIRKKKIGSQSNSPFFQYCESIIRIFSIALFIAIALVVVHSRS